ncbi:hypothetical protein [Sulfitobacter sediminilitoris]|uniref:hypothetical protein n=1 Tax=Sulfitobacter sediminilitoris TaxID=2698830 RepID=UPI00360AB1EA
MDQPRYHTTPTKGKAIHIFKLAGINPRPRGRFGQTWLRLDLDPDHVIGRLCLCCPCDLGKRQNNDQKNLQDSRHGGSFSNDSMLAADKQEITRNTMVAGSNLSLCRN